ncbi:hypothetical protein BO221_08140 [Archangium sp. Cb G35]|nr:hypothetical protein BO221_08140 [Archangium sp. Cb G35]
MGRPDLLADLVEFPEGNPLGGGLPLEELPLEAQEPLHEPFVAEFLPFHPSRCLVLVRVAFLLSLWC